MNHSSKSVLELVANVLVRIGDGHQVRARLVDGGLFIEMAPQAEDDVDTTQRNIGRVQEHCDNKVTNPRGKRGRKRKVVGNAETSTLELLFQSGSIVRSCEAGKFKVLRCVSDGCMEDDSWDLLLFADGKTCAGKWNVRGGELQGSPCCGYQRNDSNGVICGRNATVVVWDKESWETKRIDLWFTCVRHSKKMCADDSRLAVVDIDVVVGCMDLVVPENASKTRWVCKGRNTKSRTIACTQTVLLLQYLGVADVTNVSPTGLQPAVYNSLVGEDAAVAPTGSTGSYHSDDESASNTTPSATQTPDAVIIKEPSRVHIACSRHELGLVEKKINTEHGSSQIILALAAHSLGLFEYSNRMANIGKNLEAGGNPIWDQYMQNFNLYMHDDVSMAEWVRIGGMLFSGYIQAMRRHVPSVCTGMDNVMASYIENRRRAATADGSDIFQGDLSCCLGEETQVSSVTINTVADAARASAPLLVMVLPDETMGCPCTHTSVAFVLAWHATRALHMLLDGTEEKGTTLEKKPTWHAELTDAIKLVEGCLVGSDQNSVDSVYDRVAHGMPVITDAHVLALFCKREPLTRLVSVEQLNDSYHIGNEYAAKHCPRIFKCSMRSMQGKLTNMERTP